LTNKENFSGQGDEDITLHVPRNKGVKLGAWFSLIYLATEVTVDY